MAERGGEIVIEKEKTPVDEMGSAAEKYYLWKGRERHGGYDVLKQVLQERYAKAVAEDLSGRFGDRKIGISTTWVLRDEDFSSQIKRRKGGELGESYFFDVIGRGFDGQEEVPHHLWGSLASGTEKKLVDADEATRQSLMPVLVVFEAEKYRRFMNQKYNPIPAEKAGDVLGEVLGYYPIEVEQCLPPAADDPERQKPIYQLIDEFVSARGEVFEIEKISDRARQILAGFGTDFVSNSENLMILTSMAVRKDEVPGGNPVAEEIKKYLWQDKEDLVQRAIRGASGVDLETADAIFGVVNLFLSEDGEVRNSILEELDKHQEEILDIDWGNKGINASLALIDWAERVPEHFDFYRKLILSTDWLQLAAAVNGPLLDRWCYLQEKKNARLIDVFGLEKEDIARMWRAWATVDKKEMPVDRVWARNLAVMAKVEKAETGAVKRLNSIYGINHFGRYSTGILVNQYRNMGRQERPFGIWLGAYDDWNGAFYTNQEIYSLRKQLDNLGIDLIVAEAKKAREVAGRFARVARLHEGGGKVRFLVLGGHGDPEGVWLSRGQHIDVESLQSNLVDDVKKRDLVAEDFQTILDACLVGASGESLTRWEKEKGRKAKGIFVKEWGQKVGKVVGPDEATAISDFDVSLDEEDKLHIVVKYKKAKAVYG